MDQTARPYSEEMLASSRCPKRTSHSAKTKQPGCHTTTQQTVQLIPALGYANTVTGNESDGQHGEQPSTLHLQCILLSSLCSWRLEGKLSLYQPCSYLILTILFLSVSDL